MTMQEPFTPDTSRCVSCLYFHGQFDENCCCNYIFDVGERRPCPPGAACTVYRRRSAERALRICRKEEACEI